MQPPGAGTIIAGRYRLTERLGQGGMGSVWKAEHLTLHSAIAVKLIDPEISAKPEMLERFQREAQAAASLRSPHVVQVIDYGVDADAPFIAMELLEGESLADRLLRQRRLSAVETARVVTHVARALSRAHEAGIVHRDLKPSNIFIVRGEEEEELVKVLDFGIAKAPRLRADDDRTRTGAVLGSPRYMSPEQARGNRAVDARSDLWSLAVIAYRMITGQLPFQGSDMADLLVKVCTEDAPPPSSIQPSLGPEMDAFFVRALARNPDERFQTAREMALAFADAAGLSPPRTSRLPDAPPSSRKPVSDRKPVSGPAAQPALEPAREVDRATRPDPRASEAERSTEPEPGRGADLATRAESGSAPAGPDDPNAVCEPTLVSCISVPPPRPARPAAESMTVPDPVPHAPLPPPPLPPVPRRPWAESATVPEPTPPRVSAPLLLPVPRRPAVESVTVPEPTLPPRVSVPLLLPVPRRPAVASVTVPEHTPPPAASSEPTVTPDPTTSLHVAAAPEALSDRTPTPSGGILEVPARHEARRPAPRWQPFAIGGAALAALAAAFVMAMWLRAGPAPAVVDGSAPAPPSPALLDPPMPEPVAPAPALEPSATSSAAPPPEATARPRHGAWPAPPAAKPKKHSILGF
jgi:serine/threonine-protein kinase